MGMFRTVWTQLPCGRCGRLRRSGVQFKTGDDGLEDYEEGVVIPGGDDLQVGQVYEGIAERYCGPCLREFEADLALVSANATAALIENGRLRLDRKADGTAIDPAVVRAHGASVRAATKASPTTEEPRILTISFSSRDHDVIWEGVSIDWRDDAWKEYSDTLNGTVDAAMRERGWPGGRERYEDWAVVIDEEFRPYVGERL
jgi:hypothetical protein